MALDVLKWLTDDLGFTADEAKDLAPRFADRSDRLEKGYLRQSDYSRQMNDLKQTKDAIATQEAKLNADLAEFAEMTAAEQARNGDLKAKIDAAEERLFKLTQKATRLAEEAGIDPKTVVGDDPLPEPKKKAEAQPVDLGPLEQKINGVGEYLLMLNAELPAIAQEHFELTGKRFDTRAFIAGIRSDLASGKAKPEDLDPVKRWEREHNIAEIRQTKAREAHDAEIAKAREEGRLAAVSEGALPVGGTRPGSHAPVFRQTGTEPRASVLKRPQPSTKLSGAVSALATGKYRQAGQKTS